MLMCCVIVADQVEAQNHYDIKKLLYFGVSFGLISFLIPIGMYLYAGEFSGGFSKNNSDWGSFGSYLGGVMGPFFGFTSFVLLLITLFVQDKQTIELKDENLKQRHLRYLAEVNGDIHFLLTRELQFNENRKVQFGDIVFRKPLKGLTDQEYYPKLLPQLANLISEYSLALRLSNVNFDTYVEFKAHKARIESYASFLKSQPDHIKGIDMAALNLAIEQINKPISA